jgi:hypothetical protein
MAARLASAVAEMGSPEAHMTWRLALIGIPPSPPRFPPPPALLERNEKQQVMKEVTDKFPCCDTNRIGNAFPFSYVPRERPY